jgi:3-hydroxymyristoyl/3-hydroxydecanoyl-(acyl carrier protein) dehydratase
MGFDVEVTIGDSHAALAGHFPGNAIVPAVLILGEVIKAAGSLEGCPVKVLSLPSAKFLCPLRPEEPLNIHLEQIRDGELNFVCRSAGRVIATGEIRYCPLS